MASALDSIAFIDAAIERERKRHAEYAAKLAEQGRGYVGGYKSLTARAAKAIAKLERNRAKLEAGHQTEDDPTMNRRERMLREDEAAATATPGPGMVPIAARRFESGDFVFNRGCIVPAEQIQNFERLVRAGFITWVLPSNAGAVQPVRKPAPTPPQQKIEVAVFSGDDPVAAWKQSLAETAKRCGGDWGRARDLLTYTRAGGDLYVRAVKVQDERDALAGKGPGTRAPTL